MSNATGGDGAEAALVAVLDRFTDALARRDAAAAIALFAPDLDTILVGSATGEVARGPDAIRTLLEDLAAKVSVTFTWDWRVANTTGSVGWLLAEGRCHGTGIGMDVRVPYRASMVLERRGTEWLVRQYHGSEPSMTGQEPPA